jgi:hypothetical protein
MIEVRILLSRGAPDESLQCRYVIASLVQSDQYTSRSIRRRDPQWQRELDEPLFSLDPVRHIKFTKVSKIGADLKSSMNEGGRRQRGEARDSFGRLRPSIPV